MVYRIEFYIYMYVVLYMYLAHLNEWPIYESNEHVHCKCTMYIYITVAETQSHRNM